MTAHCKATIARGRRCAKPAGPTGFCFKHEGEAAGPRKPPRCRCSQPQVVYDDVMRLWICWKCGRASKRVPKGERKFSGA